MSFDEIIELSIFVTNIENFFRQIPIIPHLRENTACGCWRKTKLYSLRLNTSISSWEENVTNYLFSESLHVSFSVILYRLFFKRNCPYHPLFSTENLLFNWWWWPNDLMASITSKNLKYVERRYFWHIKTTFFINHHVQDTVIKFQALIIQLYN